MKKLIIKNVVTQNIYSKKFFLVCNHISKFYKDEFEFYNLKDIKKINLGKYDIVISNCLPKHLIDTLHKKKVVIIMLNDYKYYSQNSDICIDLIKNPEKIFPNQSKFRISKKNIQSLVKIFNLIEILEWDSRFWTYKIGFVSTRHLTKNIIFRTNRFIKNNDIKLVQYLCNCHHSSSVRLAEINNYQFKDIRLTFEKVITQKEILSNNLPTNLREANKKEIVHLQKIANSIYQDSRYYYDKNFDRSRVQDFYNEWIYKAVYKTFDDACYVYCNKDIPIAFCTIKYNVSNQATIGLFGVDKEFSGKGIGKKLLKSLFKILYKKSIKKIIVITQGRNYIAQRLYQSCGFQTSKTELWYHRWLN